MKALVLGASGILGKKIVDALAEEIEVIAGYRDLSKAIEKSNVSNIYFDYTNEESTSLAIENIDRVVIIAPSLDFNSYEKISPFIEKLKIKQIKKVVLVSALGMNLNDEAPLRKAELDLIKYDFDYTILRPNFFMENYSEGGFSSFKATGELALCTGNGKTSFISAIDIAKVVTKVILNEKYNKKEFNITGNKAISIEESINIINKKLNTNYTYTNIEAYTLEKNLLSVGMPKSNVEFLIMLLNFIKYGYMATITNDVKEILGEEPMSFEEFTSKYINM